MFQPLVELQRSKHLMRPIWNPNYDHDDVFVMPDFDGVVLPFNAQIRAQSADAPKENKPAAHHKLNNACILEHMAFISGQHVYNASFDKMAYFRQFALAPEEQWKVGTVWPASFSPSPDPADIVSFHTSCSMEFGITSASLIAQRGADANNFIFRQIMSYMLDTYWHLVPEPPPSGSAQAQGSA